MRQRLFSIPLLGATLIATACTMPLASGVSPQAQTPGPRATRAPYPTGLITGLVRGPAGIVAAGGGNVVSAGGGNLIGPAGGNLIGPAGGNMRARRVLALEEQGLAGVEVYVADAAGKPIPGLPSVLTNAKGGFSIPKVPAGFTYVVAARVKTAAGDATTLKTLAKATTLGTTVDLDVANTLVTTAVVNGRQDALGEFNAATFQRAVETTAKHLSANTLPDLADSSAVLAHMTALAEEVTELKSAVSELKSMLAKVTERLDQLEAEIKGRGEATATPAVTVSAAPTVPPVVVNVSPTPTATVAPTAAPTQAPGAAAGYNVSTLAGTGASGAVDGAANAAQFWNMRGIGLDGAGNVYVADTANKRVRKIATDGTVTTVAGLNPATTFNSPNDVAFDGTGALFVTDGGHSRVYKVLLDGTTTTLAGQSYGTVDGLGEAAKFRNPRGMTFVGGLIYMADLASSTGTRLRTLTTVGQAGTVAGSENLEGAVDVAADEQGNVYAVQGNLVVRITPQGQVIVIAGTGTGYLDGDGIEAQFSGPQGIARDGKGNLYVADTGNHRIRKITPGGTVTTIAGGAAGYADGAGGDARFNAPFDIEVDEASGRLYVSERVGQRVRVLSPQ
jgi:sugar lactone lactonase YvrE